MDSPLKQIFIDGTQEIQYIQKKTKLDQKLIGSVLEVYYQNVQSHPDPTKYFDQLCQMFSADEATLSQIFKFQKNYMKSVVLKMKVKSTKH